MRALRSIVVLGAVLALLGASCSNEDETGGEEGGPLKIGLLMDLSGPFKSFGTDIQAAVDIAVDQVNEAGGVNGSPLEIVVFDSPGEPDQAVTGVRQLTNQDDVVAIVGPVSSGESEVAFPVAASLEVPIMTGTANKEGLGELGEGWAFRDTATHTQLYTVAMPAYAEHYGVTSVVLAYDEQESFAVAASEFALPPVAEQNGIQIVDTVTFQRGQTDMTSVVQRIEDAGVDGAFIIGGPVESGLIRKEMDRQAVDLPVLGHVAQAGAAFLEAAGTDVNDWVIPSVFYAPAAGPEAEAFSEEMAAVDEEPPTVPEAANYYDLIRMIAQVAGEAGIDGSTPVDVARQEIRDGLSALEDFPGLGGPTSFLDNGDVDRPVYVLVWSGEELVELE